MKNLQNLKGAHLLSKKQQSLITGGLGGSCAYYIPSGSMDVPFGGGTAEIGCPCVVQGVSASEAQGSVSGVSGAKWCCDSCGTASWMPQQ